MNTILQKRIEEAANFLFKQRGLDKESCRQAMYYILANQWISVEEALPEVDGHGYSKPVLVMDDTNELLVATYSKIYNKWNSIGPLSYHRLVVTHWMSIPSLEGSKDE